MILGACEVIARIRLRQLDSAENVRRCRRAERIDVEAGPVTDTTRARASIPEVQGQRIERLARSEPDRDAQAAAALFQLDDITADETKPVGGTWCDERSVVPCELRQPLRQLLQPAIVGKPAIVHGRIGSEHDFKPLYRRSRRRLGYEVS